jgi:hypothetical protein
MPHGRGATGTAARSGSCRQPPERSTASEPEQGMPAPRPLSNETSDISKSTSVLASTSGASPASPYAYSGAMRTSARSPRRIVRTAASQPRSARDAAPTRNWKYRPWSALASNWVPLSSRPT